ncbi:hypothetical protein BaRGS_00020374 [Batillaria attramentaria]|uniref:Beta-lactamase-related domain-containing protein n=1 Tax=Batillaria attramentaria TaxID=370345 RepID=A0ABD0KME8_9CAEN
MTCHNNPGLAVAVVKDGQVLLSKGYGVTDLDSQQPVTTDTQFQIASLTKAFTAALLATVLDEEPGYVTSYTTGVGDVIVHTQDKEVGGDGEEPGGGSAKVDFAFNNSLRTIYATLEDLLAHRTGIPRNNYIRLATDHNRQNLPPRLKYLPNAGGFRDSFYYSDLMYALAAYVTQLLGNKPWEDLMREKVLTPLGMSRTTFISDVDFSRSDVATAYVLEHGHLEKASIDFIRHWGSNVGSGNIFSTANDMTQWMRMLLNGGKDTSGSRVLDQSVLDAVFKPSNALPPPSYAADYRRPTIPETFSSDTYGLGWRLGYYKGYKMAYHSGSTWGYRAFLTLLPDMNVGTFSVMTGSDVNYRFRTALHTYLADLALGDTPFINSSTICTFPDPWKSDSTHRQRRAANTVQAETSAVSDEEWEYDVTWRERRSAGAVRSARAASIPLSNHEGVFRHGAYGDLRVLVNASCGCLEIVYGIGQWRLEHKTGLTYEGRWVKGPPTINKDFAFLANGQEVYGVEALEFETSKVPVFYRQATRDQGLIG